MIALTFLKTWILTFWSTLNEASPYLILGLISAGLLHVLVPSRFILWALGKAGWQGALRGALVGMPLPLCSCSVIPTAIELRKQGASVAATTSFSISTPETSVDAMAVTYALLPTAFLGIRPIAALLLAAFVGIMSEFASGKKDSSNKTQMNSRKQKICQVCGLAAVGGHSHTWLTKLKAIAVYSFDTFFRDIVSWLMFGLVFAALLQMLIPENGFSNNWLGDNQNLQVLLVILVGVPLYTCATATTPLAAVLMAKGMAPGAVLAFLLSGPATNIANVFAFKKEFGKKITTAYYVSLLSFCLLSGIILNALWPWIVATFPQYVSLPHGSTSGHEHHMIGMNADEGFSWIPVLSSVFLLVLAAKVLLEDYVFHRGSGHDGHSHGNSHDDCCD